MSINDVLDKAAGKAQNTQGESLSALLASLTTSGIILALGIITYMLLKSRLPEVYSLPTCGELKWTPATITWKMLCSPMPDPSLTHPSGFDNYLFDRYLHTIARIFLLLSLATLPILLPLNVVGGRNDAGGVRGLDRLSFLNLSPLHRNRYWAHLFVAIFVVIAVCLVVQQELHDYNRLWKELAASAWDDIEGLSSLLVISDEERLSSGEIRRLFHGIAGGVRRVTVNRDYSSLRAKLQERDAAIERLEVAETKLIMKANRQRRFFGGKEYGHSRPLWRRYLDPRDRPFFRLPIRSWLPPLPWIGTRIDSIYEFRTTVSKLSRQIGWAQQHPQEFIETNSALVCLNGRLSIPLAALTLKTRISPSWTLKRGAMPNDMIWQNVSISWRQQLFRTVAVYLLVAALTLGFALPVTVAGSLSQVRYLAGVAPWLHWIEDLPEWLIAVIEGVLPQLMVFIVTNMVPIVLRFIANIQGLHSRQAVENHIQIYYFTFLFIQVFLSVSLSAGITTIIGQLKDSVESVPVVLAENLPKASNYFFSYITIYAFTAIAQILLRLSGLIQLLILSPLFDRSARQMWRRRKCLDIQQWGTFIPTLTNIACIGLIYSVIAPLILPFSLACFWALWISYRYYPPKLVVSDRATSSIFFPTAIRQLLTGIYFMEMCLAGLFFLVRDGEDRASCTVQGVIMILAMVLTAMFHYTLGRDWLRRLWHTGKKSSPAESVATKLAPEPDEALTSACPILWVPQDDRGISADEISHTRETGIMISNKGAYLDRGRLRLRGSPPASPKG